MDVMEAIVSLMFSTFVTAISNFILFLDCGYLYEGTLDCVSKWPRIRVLMVWIPLQLICVCAFIYCIGALGYCVWCLFASLL